MMSSLKGEVYEMILTLLLSDESLASGEIFSESRLTKKLHELDQGTRTTDLFSRTTLREALMRLVGEGLIEQIPQKGLRVRKVFGDEEIFRFLDYRFLIEGFVTAKLAEQTPEEQERYAIEHILREMEWAKQKVDRTKFLQADTEFHSKIAELAGYQRAAEDLRYLRIQTMLISLKAFEYDNEGRVMKDVIDEHTAIVEAIKNGEPQKARKAVQEHLRNVWPRLKSPEAPDDFAAVEEYLSGESFSSKAIGYAPARLSTALKSEVYEMILTLLLSDESLASGEIFSESRLTKKLHDLDQGTRTTDLFSRTTLREALMRLVGEGLVEQIPQKGLRVRKVTGDEEIARFFEYRFLIEGFVTAKLAQQAPEEQELYALEHTLQEMKWAKQKGDRTKILQADTEFHSKIAELAGYQRAAEDLRYLRIQTMLISLKAFEYDKGVGTQGVIDQHAAILEAIKNGEPQKARKAVQKHLHSVWTRLKSETTPNFAAVEAYLSGEPLLREGASRAMPSPARVTAKERAGAKA
jgi:GntR family transcriptional regulator, rspAB operon transcriptional repressor